jgi:hypothetical protein
MKILYTILVVTLTMISASAQLTITVDNVIEDPCPGGNKGAIETTVTGGTAPYQFNWEGPFSMVRFEEDIYNLPGGDWNLTVLDSLGATSSTYVFIPIAAGMLTSLAVDSNQATIEYVLNGNGSPIDYSYIWDFEGWKYSVGYNDTLTGLGAGDYTLVVIDTIGCSDTLQVTLEGQSVVDIVEVIKFTEVANTATLVNPVTEADIKVINYGEYIEPSETFEICRVYNITGSVVKQANDDTKISVNDLAEGIYLFYFKFGSAEILQRFYIE